MMKKLVAIAGMALILTGCSAPSNADVALKACVDEAESQVGTSIDASGLKAASLDDAMFEAGIVDDRKADTGNGLFTTAGKFTYKKDGTESRRGMICTVVFKDGTPGKADVTITDG